MGATILIYDGAPTYPHIGRFWEIIEKNQVSVFYTAPTAIRTLMKLGENLPDDFDLESLRLLGTVGEPINPKALGLIGSPTVPSNLNDSKSKSSGRFSPNFISVLIAVGAV